ncbi:ninja-family protein AFP1 [Rosa rugosa]|uniref:ninja-family protein AFP1 n=1 Tax=Rosa rugosa TaxID=74645 RepID=UPI002B403B90|nr:ninja-family protein AFP1 [Rosa rugosa]
MGEPNEGRRRAMENLTFQMDKYPRDLLQRLMCRNDASQSKYEEGNEEELELNLGLSLGGRFGVDRSEKSKLVRSSSIAVTMPFCREENDDSAAKAASYAGLMRASSLPTETEEEWRKRKELQTLRRLAAKRRRSEKQRNSSSSSSKEEEERREFEVGPTSGMRANNPAVVQPFWAARQAVGGGGGGMDPLAKGKNDILGGFQGFGLQPSSQGSVESQGGGSSPGLSEMESKPLQGSSSCGEARSPISNQDPRSNQGTTLRSLGSLTPEHAGCISRAVMENMCKKPNPSENKGRETRTNAMEDMPCVFTKGDGPNGRKIEGILYRYGKGEEVRIMCVCHGTFLSPAEFVKHAGGGDVAHPLRHIVVNPAATAFL